MKKEDKIMKIASTIGMTVTAAGNFYRQIMNGQLTRNDSNYQEAIDVIVHYIHCYGTSNKPLTTLLQNGNISIEDGDIFTEAVTRAIQEQGSGEQLYNAGIISQNELLGKRVIKSSRNKRANLRDDFLSLCSGDISQNEELIENFIYNGWAYDLITQGLISKDNPLYREAILQSIQEGYSAFLIRFKNVVKQDGDLYDMAVNKVKQNEPDNYRILVTKGLIDDVNAEPIDRNRCLAIKPKTIKNY